MDFNIRVKKTTRPKLRPVDETKLGFGKYFTDHMFMMDFDDEHGWHDPRIVPHEGFLIGPPATVLQYAQTVFEGMKAYYTPTGEIQLFRPEMNDKRLANSCKRMCIPPLPEGLLLEAIRALIEIDLDWVPTAKDTALYIRPFIFGDEDTFSVKSAEHFCCMIIMTPAGSYYSVQDGGLPCNHIFVQDQYIRAAKGGTGNVKTGGNYAGAMLGAKIAKKYGCDDVLWLDAAEHKYVEEVGTSNAFFYIGDEVITASLESGTILPGITRDSVIQLLKRWGVKVVERDLSIDEIIEASKNGTLKEAFASGTAAVISPIGCLNVMGDVYQVADGLVGRLSQKLYDNLYGIQTGFIDDYMGWTYPLGLRK